MEMGEKKSGKKERWFSKVKKAFKHGSKSESSYEKEYFVTTGQSEIPAIDANPVIEQSFVAPPSPPEPEPEVITELDNEIDSPSYTPIEPPPVPRVNKFEGKSQEEIAAIRIQTSFRGYQSRRALKSMRGFSRLKVLLEGQSVKRQSAHSLRCMQTLSRVQSQITYRRIRMSEEKQALQKQLLQKHAKDLESLRLDEEWDDSVQSKEQIETNLLSKYEAAMRRERALAYSFSHQQTWKNAPKSSNTMFMNPSNPTWGWSWLERWMAAHPWENRGVEKEPNDKLSAKTPSRGIIKSYSLHQKNIEKLSPSINKKPKAPKAEEDAKSMVSVQSSRGRRRSMGSAGVADESSLPSYMVPTESTMARSRVLGGTPAAAGENGAAEKSVAGGTKKRYSYPPSPAKVKLQSAADAGVVVENDEV